MQSTNDPPSGCGRAPEPRSEEGLELRPTADGSYTLYDPEVDQTYHSSRGAIAEARYVYLGASGAARRLAEGEELRVLEVGLGTGMNLLLTLDAATSGGALLHYRALERRPPPAEQVRRMELGRFLERPELVDAWLEILDDLRERELRERELRSCGSASFVGGARLTKRGAEAAIRPSRATRCPAARCWRSPLETPPADRPADRPAARRALLPPRWRPAGRTPGTTTPSAPPPVRSCGPGRSCGRARVPWRRAACG